MQRLSQHYYLWVTTPIRSRCTFVKTLTIITMENKRFPLPPFTMETALQKVQAAEDA
ncbi:MAG TPA: hypothetical protein VGC01_08820 [Mucilaginibacter sp.]